MALGDRVIPAIIPPFTALPRGPFVGTVVAEAAGPPAVAGETPKSPAAAGIVHAMLGISDYDEALPESFMGFISSMNGAVPWMAIAIEDDVAVTQLTTQIQRRTIGRD